MENESIDINGRNKFGQTALSYAIFYSDIELLKIMLSIDFIEVDSADEDSILHGIRK